MANAVENCALQAYRLVLRPSAARMTCNRGGRGSSCGSGRQPVANVRHALVLQPMPPAHARLGESIFPVAPAGEGEVERVDRSPALRLQHSVRRLPEQFVKKHLQRRVTRAAAAANRHWQRGVTIVSPLKPSAPVSSSSWRIACPHCHAACSRAAIVGTSASDDALRMSERFVPVSQGLYGSKTCRRRRA
jgi:hypothetical protein